jgi:hypothetical protein
MSGWAIEWTLIREMGLFSLGFRPVDGGLKTMRLGIAAGLQYPVWRIRIERYRAVTERVVETGNR